jgi:hypothetical protein
MDNQPAVSIVAVRPADHLKRYSDIFVQDGPGMMPAAQRLARQREIEQISDEMASSRNYHQFETALRKAHKRGAFPYNDDVSIVAFADVLFAD